MPLELHPKCKARLIDAVAGAISKLNVEHGQYIDRYPASLELKNAESILPDKGELREQLINYIDADAPLTEFVIDSISEELRQFPYEPERSLQPLTSIGSYSDSRRAAERLVDQFASLPMLYTFSLKLPPAFLQMAGTRTRVELSPQLRIVRSDPELFALYPPEAEKDFEVTGGLLGGLARFINPPSSWENDSAYLQFDASGFVGPYGGTSPHLDAVRTIRAFCGLGLAVKLFEMKSEFSAAMPPVHMLVHRKGPDDQFAFFCSLSLDENVSRAVNGLTLDALEGRIDSEQKQLKWADRQFDAMRAVFAGRENAEKLLLASQWYFDGHSHGSDALLKYIQTTVVLEILLGDKASSDQTGLGALLGNRCAYLIGNSQQERTEVLNAFHDIYRIRSEIVHRGKHRLNYKERVLFLGLRWMCRRVIQREIELLKADKKSQLIG
jgi:hypothetical protein